MATMILGIDEVGRGCWAGPLVAGAVLLDGTIPGLRDSKKLSPKQREHLDALIRLQSPSFGIGWVSPEEIDTRGLSASVKLAMERAVGMVTGSYDDLVIDGNVNYLAGIYPSRCVVRADDLVPAVSAASIIAKVARDAYMREQSQPYPMYGFSTNVGYGTALHMEALREHGPCALHRRSFAPVRDIGGA